VDATVARSLCEEMAKLNKMLIKVFTLKTLKYNETLSTN
jgi:hypothetical protein